MAGLGSVADSTDIAIPHRTDYHDRTVEILERLSPAHWWTDPTEPIGGPLHQAFTIFLVLVYMAGVASWLLASRLAPTHSLHRRLIARAGKWATALAVIGLILLLFRWMVVPFLAKRLWLYLWAVAVVSSLAYAAWYGRKTYPQDRAAWQDSERKRRYRPKAARAGTRSRRRSRRHR